MVIDPFYITIGLLFVAGLLIAPVTSWTNVGGAAKDRPRTRLVRPPSEVSSPHSSPTAIVFPMPLPGVAFFS